MNRNVEIKARLRDPEGTRHLLEQITGGPPEILRQEDTYFPCPSGRLKLRVVGSGRGELIAYRRSDAPGPKVSGYVISSTQEPDRLRETLATALGVGDIVRKTRLLFLVGQTRVHLDSVEGLGEFLELEVVLRAGQPIEDGAAIARDLMTRLGIADADLLQKAYVDMIRRPE